MHVNDTVDAFIKILEDGKINEIYNIGCDEVEEILFLTCKKIHKICKIKTQFKHCIEYIKTDHLMTKGIIFQIIS